MTGPLNYPLQQLMVIKQNRFDQAVKTLEQKKEILVKEMKALSAVTLEKDKVAEHKKAKLDQLRQSLDEGTTTDKIQQKKVYLKTVEEQLAEKTRKVVAQQKVVDAAKNQVELATKELFQRKKDLEKLQMHREEWEKQVRYWVDQKEAVIEDEQGSATHSLRKKEAKKRKGDES